MEVANLNYKRTLAMSSFNHKRPTNMAGGSIISQIKTPIGAVLMIVIVLILASLTVAASVSGDLTAAAVSAAGLLVIVLLIAMIAAVGKN